MWLAKAHSIQYSAVNYSSWSMTPGWLDMLKFDFTLLLCSSQDRICTAPSFVISCAALCSNRVEWNLKECTNVGMEWILFSYPHNLINVKSGNHQAHFRQLSIIHDMYNLSLLHSLHSSLVNYLAQIENRKNYPTLSDGGLGQGTGVLNLPRNFFCGFWNIRQDGIVFPVFY